MSSTERMLQCSGCGHKIIHDATRDGSLKERLCPRCHAHGSYRVPSVVNDDAIRTMMEKGQKDTRDQLKRAAVNTAHNDDISFHNCLIKMTKEYHEELEKVRDTLKEILSLQEQIMGKKVCKCHQSPSPTPETRDDLPEVIKDLLNSSGGIFKTIVIDGKNNPFTSNIRGRF